VHHHELEEGSSLPLLSDLRPAKVFRFFLLFVAGGSVASLALFLRAISVGSAFSAHIGLHTPYEVGLLLVLAGILFVWSILELRGAFIGRTKKKGMVRATILR